MRTVVAVLAVVVGGIGLGAPPAQAASVTVAPVEGQFGYDHALPATPVWMHHSMSFQDLNDITLPPGGTVYCNFDGEGNESIAQGSGGFWGNCYTTGIGRWVPCSGRYNRLGETWLLTGDCDTGLTPTTFSAVLGIVLLPWEESTGLQGVATFGG